MSCPTVQHRINCMNRFFVSRKVSVRQEKLLKIKSIRFVVMVSRGGARAPQYVERLDRNPIQTTSNRKRALTMGRFTAEDAIKSMQNSRCIPELVPVQG